MYFRTIYYYASHIQFQENFSSKLILQIAAKTKQYSKALMAKGHWYDYKNAFFLH